MTTTTNQTSALTQIFADVRVQLARYVYCPTFVMGNIGNTLNIFVFAREPLRTSVCSIYFLIISISNLILINISYLTRILPTLDVPDPSRNTLWYCKGRAYISGLFLTLTRHFLCLIAIDRFLITSTSVALRNFSSFKVAKRLVPISCLIWAIFYVHTLIGYENTRGGTSCGRQAGFYSTFTTVCTVSIDAIIPIVVMSVFTLLMIKQIRALRLRREKNVISSKTFTINKRPVMTITGTIEHNDQMGGHNQANNWDAQRQQEKHLTRLSFAQVVLYIMLNLPNAVYVVYMLVATNNKKTADEIAIESFVSSFASILTYVYLTVRKITFALPYIDS
ncbi:unnamed protein product [Adineta ricciae]|uniref:G-protein coupled receptors family 1 profile domain-containing protein n=1 Tax=Adineta ricciae TaxID=249248 RepID=A0A813S0P0_ADIRI|nr:unnamed protein product [Adineta ricciae]